MDYLSHLSQAQIKEYSEAFAMFDEEGEGRVSIERLGEVLRSIGLRPELPWLETLKLKKLEEGESTVDYLEFLTLTSTSTTMGHQEQQALHKRVKALRKAFRSFDSVQAQTAPAIEVRDVMLRTGMPEDQVDRLLAAADPQGTGVIQYKDFVESVVHE
eukprot:RCo035183